ncbi:baseplate J/gp47 family protein [Campylobacter mucosalis]|uniref:baseplate J/gp47 family protein n=1 Tax=Campylobacter mucosalis TaxID=202 RepID=UPI001470851C|nr:baseplate J/gp47 family protein [Campylobacter mucosalis]
MQVTNTGIIIDDLSAIKERLENGFKRIYGSDINLNYDTPDGQMIGLFSQALSEVNEILAYITQMLDPYLAQGEWLDQRVAYAGVLRKTAEFSTASGVAFHGDKGVKIPKNTELKDKKGNLWQTDSEIILGTNGSAVVSITAKEMGELELKSQSELELSEIILGVDRVVATQDAKVGSDEESDAELLKRFMLSHSINNNDDRIGLEATLLNLKGVTQAKVLENYTNQTDANEVPAHSINAIVLGGADELIAEAILRKKIGGCGLYGSCNVEISFLGLNREVKFDRPTQVNPKIKLNIKRIQNFIDINEKDIKKALSSHVFKIGESLYASRLYCIVNVVNGFEITSLTIDGAQSKEIAVREIAVILEKDIEIVVDNA